MTIDQLNKLSDKEVRVLCAERMGCKWLKAGKYRIPTFDPVIDPGCYSPEEFADGSEPIGSLHHANIPNYPTDLNAAFTLVEKLREEGWRFMLDNIADNWEAEFFRRTPRDSRVKIEASPARAICLAFLAVTEREEG